jgi:hypothetical protein
VTENSVPSLSLLIALKMSLQMSKMSLSREYMQDLGIIPLSSFEKVGPNIVKDLPVPVCP